MQVAPNLCHPFMSSRSHKGCGLEHRVLKQVLGSFVLSYSSSLDFLQAIYMVENLCKRGQPTWVRYASTRPCLKGRVPITCSIKSISHKGLSMTVSQPPVAQIYLSALTKLLLAHSLQSGSRSQLQVPLTVVAKKSVQGWRCFLKSNRSTHLYILDTKSVRNGTHRRVREETCLYSLENLSCLIWNTQDSHLKNC